MKRMMLVLMSIALFAACSSDNEENEPEMDKTSLVYKSDALGIDKNVVVGYYKDGLCLSLAKLGNIEGGETSKEIIITDPSILEVVIFYEGRAELNGEANRIDETYSIKKNTKNIIEPSKGVKVVVVSKDDKTQYPH